MSAADLVSELRRSPVIAPAVVAFRGPDAGRYLNGQTTQDVRLVNEGGRALPSCVTDAKGRLQFRVWIHRGADGTLFVSCEHAEPEALFARLSRYLIADDAEAEDESGRWRMVHVTGDLPGDFQEFAVAANRFGEPGWDIWIPEGAPDERLAPLLAIPEWPAEEAEARRIEAGIPAWGAELLEGMLPPEARLDRTDISYAKGCYIGQEVISRIKSAGKVNRKLVRLAVAPGIAVVAGAKLIDAAGADSGIVTSVSPVAGPEKRALLGYLKRGAATADLRLETGGAVGVSEVG